MNLRPIRVFESLDSPVRRAVADEVDLGAHPEAAAEVETAIAGVVAARKVRTPDLGGTATTASFTQAVLDQLSAR